MKRIFYIVGLFIFSAESFSQNIPFQSGEYTSYKIYFSSIWVGNADMEVSKREINNKESLYIKGTGRTAPFFDFFFKVRDTYETFLDVNTILPIEFIRDVNEGGYLINQHYIFNHSENKVITKDSSYFIPNFTQDMLSAFFYARTLNKEVLKMRADSTFNIPIFIDNENYNIAIKYLGNELVNTKWRQIECMVFQPKMQEGRIFENGEKMKIWVTDDVNRILIKAETIIWAGKIRATLNNYRGLKRGLSNN